MNEAELARFRVQEMFKKSWLLKLQGDPEEWEQKITGG